MYQQLAKQNPTHRAAFVELVTNSGGARQASQELPMTTGKAPLSQVRGEPGQSPTSRSSLRRVQTRDSGTVHHGEAQAGDAAGAAQVTREARRAHGEAALVLRGKTVWLQN
ncbi:hypothetical protein H920_04827 [Fukomys damarensis]|uniref:Uncharacterized protein n=1 Tax=Fukomys damarensis TaxID=885580 RepID=A0A091DTN6_FUKDA|nr:hypothetical protein H920_04827 [Fukomys damarensis]